MENRRLPAHAIASTDASVEPIIVCCKYGAFCKFQISIDASSLKFEVKNEEEKNVYCSLLQQMAKLCD